MTTQNDLDRTLGAWFHGDATTTPPPEPLARAIESTRHLRPRPCPVAWIGSSWIGARGTSGAPTGVAGLRPALVIGRVEGAAQRRSWRGITRQAWGLARVTSLAAAAVTILLAVAVSGVWLSVGGGSVPRSTSTPSAPASTPSPVANAFVSTLYRYSVQVPSSWVVTRAMSPWGGNSTLDTDATETDIFRAGPQTDAPTVSVRGQVLASGVTAAAWLDRWKGREGADASGRCFGSPSPWSSATVDGVVAWYFNWRCENGQDQAGNYDEYAFVLGDEGYVISGAPSMVDVLTASFKTK